jgi:hypothetical protein
MPPRPTKPRHGLTRSTAEPSSDWIWNAPAIARHLGCSVKQVYFWHSQGHFKGAVWKFSPKILVASRAKLRALANLPEAESA